METLSPPAPQTVLCSTGEGLPVGVPSLSFLPSPEPQGPPYLPLPTPPGQRSGTLRAVVVYLGRRSLSLWVDTGAKTVRLNVSEFRGNPHKT